MAQLHLDDVVELEKLEGAFGLIRRVLVVEGDGDLTKRIKQKLLFGPGFPLVGTSITIPDLEVEEHMAGIEMLELVNLRVVVLVVGVIVLFLIIGPGKLGTGGARCG